MAMLKRKIIIKAFLHELPKLAAVVARGRNNDREKFLYEINRLYGQLGLYDHIIDKIRMGRVI